MSDPKTEIQDVKISDLHTDNQNDNELEDSQLDRVSGGGAGYGYDPSAGS